MSGCCAGLELHGTARRAPHHDQVRGILLRRRQPDLLPGLDAAAEASPPRPARRSSGGRCCSAASSRRPATRARSTVPAKGRWMNDDIARWARRYGVPFALQSALPDQHADVDARRDRPADAPARRLRALPRRRVRARCGRRRATSATRPCSAATLADAGFDAGGVRRARRRPGGQGEAASRPPRKRCARGVFGAPTFFVGEQMFFGQDRLDFVREALC